MFALSSTIDFFVPPCGKGSTLEYAVSELSHLLSLCGCRAKYQEIQTSHPAIMLGNVSETDLSKIRFDGFSLTIRSEGVSIEAPTEKGVLNGVYEFAERLGFRFLTPFPDGELVPEQPKKLSEGTTICNPRFPHRGIFITPVAEEIPMADRLRFFAKLKYNVVRNPLPFAGEEALCRMPEISRRGSQSLHIMIRFSPIRRFLRNRACFCCGRPANGVMPMRSTIPHVRAMRSTGKRFSHGRINLPGSMIPIRSNTTWISFFSMACIRSRRR